VRVAQIVLPGASQYERKSQRIDAAALQAQGVAQVVGLDDAPDVAHVYANGELPAARFVRFPVPYVASAPLPPSRFSLRKPTPPRKVVGPAELPEAVEETWFGATRTRLASDVKVIGSFARSTTKNMVEQTVARIHRFRADVTWNLYAEPPTPEGLAGVDLWVDPATDEGDLDGFVAEALVLGLPVVASRTEVNRGRLEQGRTGFLVPPRDPNEMTHAILAALFKAEVAESKQSAARQTVSKFRARHRLRILLPLYESLIA
jgi:hypothetical protein